MFLCFVLLPLLPSCRFWPVVSGLSVKPYQFRPKRYFRIDTVSQHTTSVCAVTRTHLCFPRTVICCSEAASVLVQLISLVVPSLPWPRSDPVTLSPPSLFSEDNTNALQTSNASHISPLITPLSTFSQPSHPTHLYWQLSPRIRFIS